MPAVGGDGIAAAAFDQKAVLAQDFKELVPSDTQVGQVFPELATSDPGLKLPHGSDLWKDLQHFGVVGRASPAILVYGLSTDLEHMAALA